MLGLQNEREWVEFCRQVLLQPDLVDDPRFNSNSRRVANRTELVSLIEQIFRGLTAAELVERLDRAHIANARLNLMEDFWQHPQLEARKRWREVDSPVGPIPALLPPATFAAFETRMDPVPALSAHTDKVLAGLGYSNAEMARFHREAVV
jgi:itaconate CoA-transferase